jgi:hypothetical protein
LRTSLRPILPIELVLNVLLAPSSLAPFVPTALEPSTKIKLARRNARTSHPHVPPARNRRKRPPNPPTAYAPRVRMEQVMSTATTPVCCARQEPTCPLVRLACAATSSALQDLQTTTMTLALAACHVVLAHMYQKVRMALAVTLLAQRAHPTPTRRHLPHVSTVVRAPMCQLAPLEAALSTISAPQVPVTLTMTVPLPVSTAQLASLLLRAPLAHVNHAQPERLTRTATQPRAAVNAALEPMFPLDARAPVPTSTAPLARPTTIAMLAPRVSRVVLGITWTRAGNLVLALISPAPLGRPTVMAILPQSAPPADPVTTSKDPGHLGSALSTSVPSEQQTKTVMPHLLVRPASPVLLYLQEVLVLAQSLTVLLEQPMTMIMLQLRVYLVEQALIRPRARLGPAKVTSAPLVPLMATMTAKQVVRPVQLAPTFPRANLAAVILSNAQQARRMPTATHPQLALRAPLDTASPTLAQPGHVPTFSVQPVRRISTATRRTAVLPAMMAPSRQAPATSVRVLLAPPAAPTTTRIPAQRV